MFAFGLAVVCSMYVIGFCETLIEMGLCITGDEQNDIRSSGLILLTL